MRHLAFALVAAIFAFTPGCASKPATSPDWISGNSAQYPAELYLTGRGQATTEEEAKDRARADLSKIFQVAVTAASEDVQKFESSQEGEGQYQSHATLRVTTHTSQIIRGIRIAELWRDPATGNFHALAVLPRLQTATSLRQQISQLDDDTGKHIEQSRKNNDLFLKIAAASQAVKAQQSREALQKSLQIIDVTGRGLEPKWHSTALEGDLDDLLKRVRIASEVSADSAPGLADVTAGALTKAGFMIETGQNPDFVLRSRLVLDDLGFRDGWYWQRGVLEIVLSETAENRVRGTKRWTVKGNAPDRESAAKRAFNQADTLLKQELRGVVIDMASNPQ